MTTYKNTYLVTGGSGFIGSHLVQKLLKEGNRVINIDNFDDFYDYKIKILNTLESVCFKGNFVFSNNKEQDVLKLQSTLQSDSYRLVFLDIRSPEVAAVFEKEKIDVVIHLAALAGVRPSIENPLMFKDVNINGTVNLLEFCASYNINKFICASSSSVYGNNKETPFDEKDIVDYPISPYAATKKCVEILSHTYHHLNKIDIIQLRFFTVYGPRQRPDLAIHKFTKLIINKEKIPFFGDGTTARDYTYIDDIIEGVYKSILYIEKESGVYQVFNLGENEVIPLDKMVVTLEEAIGTKAVLNKLPMQKGDVNITNANITKAKKMLGYNPKVNFKEGISRFVKWYLKKNYNTK